jgi:hypothetical protein
MDGCRWQSRRCAVAFESEGEGEGEQAGEKEGERVEGKKGRKGEREGEREGERDQKISHCALSDSNHPGLPDRSDGWVG